MPRVIACLVVLAAGLVVPAGAAAATRLSAEQARVHADAYGGRTAWSSFDTASRVWRLMTIEDGKAVAVRARAATHPFRLDLGPGPNGRPIAVYPRCRRESCDLYRYDFAKREERRLRGVSSRTASESLPSIWRSRIAFARREGQTSTIYLSSLDGKRSTVVPGGLRTGPSGALAIELRGRRVVYVWQRVGDGGLRRTELWSALDGRTRLLDVTGRFGERETTFVTPEIRGRRVYYGRPVLGGSRGHELRRAHVTRSRVEWARAPFSGIVTAVWLADRFLLSRALLNPATTDPEAECRRPGQDPAATVCSLVVGDRIARWKRLAGR